MKMKTKAIKSFNKNNLSKLSTKLHKIEDNPVFLEAINKIKKIPFIADNGFGTMKIQSLIEIFLIQLLDRDSKKDLSMLTISFTLLFRIIFRHSFL